MELWWLVPVVFGLIVLVIGVLFLTVLIPAAKRQVEADARRRDEAEGSP
ncbi:MAG TPA: hypothetical protein VN200_11785 [Rhodoglobus sp.]|nr:hypothetical protein [Rhodoglobus sp.]